MTITTHWFVIGATLTAVLCSIAIWAPRSLKLKVTALLCATMFLPVGYISLNDILSRPKPVTLELAHRQVQEATVLGALMREGAGIFLWLQLPDIDEPRSYRLPWTEEAAKQLHRAQQESEQSGTPVKMKKPFEQSLDSDDPVFYAAPHAPLPPKQLPDDKPIVFSASAKS